MSNEQDGVEDLDLTEEQIEEYKEAFSIFDADGDGSISTDEMTTVVRSLGYNPSQDEIKKMIRDVDTDGNGQVDFNEFVHLMQKKLKNYYTEEIIKEAFDVMDSNGEGYITFPRLKQLVQDMGLQISDEEVQEMMAEADVEGEGLVRYDALIQLLSFDNETLYEAYKRNQIIRQQQQQPGTSNEGRDNERIPNEVDQNDDHHSGSGNEHSFDIGAAIEDGQVPDIETISRQYGRGKYDRFSRKPVEKPKVVKVPGQKVQMSRTRMAYLHRKNKALGPDKVSMTDDGHGDPDSLKREQKRTMEPWLGSIHDQNSEFVRKFKANPPEQYKNVNSKIMDNKYYVKRPVPKPQKQTKAVLQQKTVVVEINNGVARCGVDKATRNAKQNTSSVKHASKHKNGGYTYHFTQQNQKHSNRDNTSALSVSNDTALSTDTQIQYGKQTNVITTDKDKPKGYMEMINVKTKERIYYAVWRTAFMEAIKKITEKEEKQSKSTGRKSSEDKDVVQPTVLTPSLPMPLPRGMITNQHAGSYADCYRKIHNMKAQTPVDPHMSSPSPRLKRHSLPEHKPLMVTKDKLNAMAAMYGSKM